MAAKIAKVTKIAKSPERLGAWRHNAELIEIFGLDLCDTTRDFSGVSQGFLATEEGFRFVKDLHTRNLIVPVVGDFGGPSAMRRVGDYVRRHGEVINAVYGSNVGAYLTTQQTRAFCRNLESLPAASPAWFIDSHGRRSLQAKLRTCPTDTN